MLPMAFVPDLFIPMRHCLGPCPAEELQGPPFHKCMVPLCSVAVQLEKRGLNLCALTTHVQLHSSAVSRCFVQSPLSGVCVAYTSCFSLGPAHIFPFLLRCVPFLAST